MLFRSSYKIQDLNIAKNYPFQFEFGSERVISILVQRPNDGEIVLGKREALCKAEVEFDVSSKNESIFSQIERNEILSDGACSFFRYKIEDMEIRLPSLDKFPHHFQSLVKKVEDELFAATKSVVSVLRWRCNQPGPRNPLSPGDVTSLKWSRDGSTWHPMPLQAFKVYVLANNQKETPLFDKETQNHISRLVDEFGTEPIYHELFREAWEYRLTSPRAAVVIGVSAAEVAVKQCISLLVPNSQWLVENVPSPPILKILREYLPSLSAKNRINNNAVTFPSEMLETLNKGVTIRNQLIHTGKPLPEPKTVDKVLSAVQDLLWIIDYYCGHEWALDYLQERTRVEMELNRD